MAILTENGLSHTIEKIVNLLKGKSNTDHKHTKSDITDFPTLGTSSSKDVASSGNASTYQVVMGNDTRLSDSRKASDVSAWAKASTKPTYTASEVGASPTGHTHDDRYYTESEIDSKLNGKLSTSLKGSASGLAELDLTGKVPSAQLPSFVDDVIEGYLSSGKFYKESAHTTEISGESGKIYIDLSTEKTYRWSGSSFVVISDTITLGETSTTAYRGDRGKTAYDHSQSTHARIDATKVEKSTTNGNIKINGTETTVYTHPSGTNPHGTTKNDVGLGNVDNTADSNKSVKYASDAGTVNSHTVNSDVPSDAKFTDTVYTHPTTSGNKHIPSGGSNGQVLKYSSDGTATWGTVDVSSLSLATESANGLMSSIQFKNLRDLISTNVSAMGTKMPSSYGRILKLSSPINGSGNDAYGIGIDTSGRLYTYFGNNGSTSAAWKTLLLKSDITTANIYVTSLTLGSMTLQGNYDGDAPQSMVTANGSNTPLCIIPRSSGSADVCWIDCYMNNGATKVRLKNTVSGSKTFSPSVYVIYKTTVS